METGLVEGTTVDPLPPSDGAGMPGASAATMVKAEELEARGAELVGVMAAATAGLVEVLAEAITTDAWRGAGIRSVEHWAGLRFGLSGGRARRLVAAATALADLPACREAFAAGAITEDHITAVVRGGVTADHDEEAAGLARSATVTQLQRALSFLPQPPPPPPGDEPEDAGGGTSPVEHLSTGFDDGGSWSIHGRADADRGALIERALLAARDALFRARHQDRTPDPADLEEISGMDALEHLATVALDALDPSTSAGGRPSERYIVDYHLSAQDPNLGRVHLGPPLPAWLRSLIGCDAEIRPWIQTADGNVNLGRRQHTVDPKLRKVIEHRDGGCAIPGCDANRWLAIHHVRHWGDGGPTDVDNLVAVCRAHHRLVHKGELVLTRQADGTFAVTTVDGRAFGPSPPRPPRRPLPDAAADAGLGEPEWTNRSGERADWRWFSWNTPTDLRP